MKIKIVYQVPENCRASADLMGPDGSFIRNLWNHKQLAANKAYTEIFEDVNQLPAGTTYKLRLTTNNIRTYWESVLGNNSAKASGKTKFYNMDQAKDMDAGTNHFFYGCAYNEGKTSCFRIPKNNLRVNEPVFATRGMNCHCITVKNGIAYWAGVDPGKTATWGDEFARRFIDERQPLKQACQGFPDYTEDKIRRCSLIYIDAQDFFIGYRKPETTKRDFVEWFDQYVFRADWSKLVSGIWATNENDNSEIVFAWGQSYKPTLGMEYKSMIGLYEGLQAEITGLAVSNSCIYVAYGGQAETWYWNSRDLIKVFNLEGKELGQVIVPKPGKMIAVDNYLFYCSGTKICRAKIDATGNIEQDNELQVNGDFTVMDVSYYKPTDTIKTLTTDGLVRYYDKNFELKKELGNPEMYWEKPQVYQDKFYLEDMRGTYESFLCTDPVNGLQLVGDGGNQRIQIFDRNFLYKSTICWQSCNYATNVIDSEPHRIFSYFLEFNRDYQADPKRLIWKLVNNWGCYADYNWLYCDMPFVINGKTYAKQQAYNTNQIRLIELDPESGLKPLNIVTIPNNIHKAKVQVYPDGSIYRDETKPGYYVRISKQNFLGVNEDGTFNWAAPLVIVNTDTPPPGSTWNNMSRRYFETIGPTLYLYNAHRQELGNHLTAINMPDGKFIANGFPSTHPGYFGEYIDDFFDIANGVVYPGGVFIARDKFINCNVHGEFWGAGQTNKWHLFTPDLVALHTYGTDIKTIRKQGIEWPAPQMAGNSFAGNFVKAGAFYYLYHCDEGHHGGIHAVRYEGMETVKRYMLGATVYEVADNPYYVFPLAGLPASGPIKSGDGGWEIDPAEAYSTSATDHFAVKMGVKYISRIEPSDLQLNFRIPNRAGTAIYPLDPVTPAKWQFTGYINYENNNHSRDNGTKTGCKLQLVDGDNQVLFELYPVLNYSTKTVTLYINNQVVFTLDQMAAGKILDYFRFLNVWASSNILTAKFHNYPAIVLGRVDTKPARLRLMAYNFGGISQEQNISVRTLKFNRR